MRPTEIPVEKIAALGAACLRMTVPEAYRDENGHMNVRWYARIFDEAGDVLHERFGITPQFHEARGTGTMDLENHINYLHEVLIGDHLAIFARLVAVSAKRVHYLLFMINETRGDCSCLFECVNSFVDLKARKTAPFPPEIAARIRAEVDVHATLNWPPPICGAMQA